MLYVYITGLCFLAPCFILILNLSNPAPKPCCLNYCSFMVCLHPFFFTFSSSYLLSFSSSKVSWFFLALCSSIIHFTVKLIIHHSLYWKICLSPLCTCFCKSHSFERKQNICFLQINVSQREGKRLRSFW